MLFLLDMLEQLWHRMPDVRRAQRLLKAGRALEELLNIWRQAGMRLSAAEQVHSWDCFQRFIVSTEPEPDCMIPKRHQFLHILQRIPDMGNPKRYANWMDETLNRHLKQVCRHASQTSFEASIYRRMREWLRRFHRKRSAE